VKGEFTMNDQEKVTLTIQYVTGSVQKFEYPRQEDTFNVATRIQEMSKANFLILELADKALVIPYQNIQAIEISPPPVKLPPNTLKNVRLIQ